MAGRYLVELGDVLRAAGLDVVEVDGWQNRARGSGGYADGRPWAVMWHHTASQTTPQNDVAYIVSGSSVAPVANLYLARDGVVWVCAGGATNTNGNGGPYTVSRGTVPQDKMNEYAVSVEAANSGVGEVWPQVQIDAYFTVSLAVTDWLGLAPTDALGHYDWTPGRKIDPATAAAVQGPWRPRAVNSSGTWSLDDIHAELIRRHTTTPTPPTPTPPPNGDDMRAGPYLIQATGKDGTPPGRVYATDGNMMAIRWLATTEALEGYRWQATQVFGWTAPELAPGAPVLAVDTIAAFGVIIE